MGALATWPMKYQQILIKRSLTSFFLASLTEISLSTVDMTGVFYPSHQPLPHQVAPELLSDKHTVKPPLTDRHFSWS